MAAAASATAAPAPALPAPLAEPIPVDAPLPAVPLVLVTGASGYIAMHVVHQLLAAGYRVRGTVRDPTNPKKVAPFRALPGAAERLELVEADLLNKDHWAAAVAGADFVLHTASPFPLAKPKDEAELIRPAVDGTLTVLEACALPTSVVRRVVLTSSFVAIGDGHGSVDAKVWDERDWSVADHCEPYAKSKTLAERAAWEFVNALPKDGSRHRFELATINPGLVVGPLLTHGYCTSAEIPIRLLTRGMPAIPNFGIVAVDVRDVARAHILAMRTPEAAGQRFLTVARYLRLPEMANDLAAAFDPRGFNIPTSVLPKWIAWTASWFDAGVAQIYSLIDKTIEVDNSKIRRVLGLEFRDLRTSMVEMAETILQVGLAPDLSPGKAIASKPLAPPAVLLDGIALPGVTASATHTAEPAAEPAAASAGGGGGGEGGSGEGAAETA